MKNSRILVIDDNGTHRMIMRAMLEQRGYKVTEADNGTDGLKCILNDKPDCIFLDHLMAGGNGLSVLLQLDKRNLNPPPVIYVSAHLDEITKRKAMALGATVCMEKSELATENLISVMRRLSVPIPEAA